MKKVLSGVIFMSALALVVIGCSQNENMVDPDGFEAPVALAFDWIDGEEPCAVPQVVPFYAGQFIDIGTVTASLDEGLLCIDIQTTGNWVLVQTHATLGLDLDSLPLTGSGNPQVGHFIFQTDHDPPVTSFSYCTDPLDYLYEPGDVYIAVHAEAVLLDDAGNPIQEETAWADGPQFPGRSWATYFILAIESCPVGGEEEELCLEGIHEITWDPAVASAPVDIVLLQDGVSCLTIARGVENTGLYVWEGVQSCDSGVDGGYTIQVIDTNGTVVDESGPFLIIPCFEKR